MAIPGPDFACNVMPVTSLTLPHRRKLFGVGDGRQLAHFQHLIRSIRYRRLHAPRHVIGRAVSTVSCFNVDQVNIVGVTCFGMGCKGAGYVYGKSIEPALGQVQCRRCAGTGIECLERAPFDAGARGFERPTVWCWTPLTLTMKTPSKASTTSRKIAATSANPRWRPGGIIFVLSGHIVYMHLLQKGDGFAVLRQSQRKCYQCGALRCTSRVGKRAR